MQGQHLELKLNFAYKFEDKSAYEFATILSEK